MKVGSAGVSSVLERLVSSGRVTGRRRTLCHGLAFASIVVIALTNSTFDIGLRAFYAIPVVVVTVAVSTRAGYVEAAVASLAWSIDRAIVDPLPAVATTANGLLRFAGFALLVVIVSTLRSAVETARASEQRSRDFLTFAAHQLRTPVAGVRASAEALLLTDDPVVRGELLGGLTGEAGRMGRLIASLLRMARLDQGDVLGVVASDPRPMIAFEVQRARRVAGHLDIRLSLYEDGPEEVVVDPAALTEMVVNLLDNARRHAVGQISVEASYEVGVLQICVADDGSGLPLGQEEQAFERFVSLDGLGGSGLGLPIARALAEGHGGLLLYDGRQFVIRVPAPPRS